MSGERRRSGPESRNAAGLESTGTDFETRCTSTCTSIEFIIIAYLGHLGGDATTGFLASSQDSEMAQLKVSTSFETQPPDVP